MTAKAKKPHFAYRWPKGTHSLFHSVGCFLISIRHCFRLVLGSVSWARWT